MTFNLWATKKKSPALLISFPSTGASATAGAGSDNGSNSGHAASAAAVGKSHVLSVADIRAFPGSRLAEFVRQQPTGPAVLEFSCSDASFEDMGVLCRIVKRFVAVARVHRPKAA